MHCRAVWYGRKQCETYKMYYSIKMKLHTLLYILPSFILLLACNGVDRSGEQPFAPTVETLAAEAAGDGVLLNGRVTDSPNSDVLECGFLYGNDTLRVKLKSEEVSLLFSAYADSLQNGNYYAVAYARNGVGTSYGDTVRFQINK